MLAGDKLDWNHVRAALPRAMLGDWLEAQGCELKMEILTFAFAHCDCVTLGAFDGAVAVDHVEHFLLIVPYRKGGNGSRESDGGGGEGDSGVIANERFDRFAPFEKSGDFRKFHTGYGDGDNGG